MSNTKIYQKGETIIEVGAPAERAYMVLRGAAQVFLEKEGRTVNLANLHIGSIVGESALFEKETYGANVKAIEETEVLIIEPSDFQEKLESCDPMIREILRMMLERQRKTNETLLKRETQGFMDIVLIDS